MQLPGLRIDLDLGSLAWKETQVDGVSWFPLHLDEPRPGASAHERPGGCVLIRMEPGRGYERHRHVGVETVLVLQGGYRDDRGTHAVGATVRYPDGSEHEPVALGDPMQPPSADNPACVLFAVAGGIELLGR